MKTTCTIKVEDFYEEKPKYDKSSSVSMTSGDPYHVWESYAFVIADTLSASRPPSMIGVVSTIIETLVESGKIDFDFLDGEKLKYTEQMVESASQLRELYFPRKNKK